MKKSLSLLLLLVMLSAFDTHKELKWEAIGDSITYSNSHPEASQHRISIGYMDDVIKALPYIKYNNHGYPGWTAKSMAENMEKIGIEKAEIYSIFLGTNDWWVGLPIGTLSDYQDNTGNQTAYGCYRIIINKIRSLNPDAKIILMTPLQRTEYVDLNNPKVFIQGQNKAKEGVFLSQYADAIKTIAKAECFELADLYYKSGINLKNAVNFRRLRNPQTHEYKNYTYPHYIGIPYDPATDEYPYPVEAMNMTYDGLHPSDKGHAAIAKMLVKIMKRF
ncbi:SGNH/GDSL hydrolase family protein [Mucilaginibacter psychrotolerans]|uniref:SGNH/GDSL hydrolase family protein n=1 Tax=Mucilaginibacter psychrotolerans TaxID=1524096 RepID=A0A4Y8S4A7_9SPHI|nr:SGNH/GDSL hydrolase family protein [Mucilaginibacter psychrotolerans]TFF33566.1 SGNH/GDSL hydrolase family protein [Mucilaginibacter psychrotolerans]